MVLKIILLLTIFSINYDVFAIIKPEINPEWEKYILLNEEEKALYEAIPEQYIYQYNYSNKNYNIYDNIEEYDLLPETFNLTNYNGNNYVNTLNKNQSILGLCWAFATIGSLESNLLLNGADGLIEHSNLCNSNNLNSTYCNYKKDYEINEQYKKNLITDNVTFSERHIDYIVSEPAGTYSNNGTGPYTLIQEKYNIYSTPNRLVGAGGNFNDAALLFSYGISPIRTINNWEKYTTSMNTISLEQLYDNVPVNYVVTDYYNYPSKPTTEPAKIDWMNNLKRLIKKYGAVYVSTVAPQTAYGRACYYYDQNEKMGIIHYDADCGTASLGWHAMQIVGWDDTVSYNYCKANNIGTTEYTKDTCEKNGYEYVSGKGVWILKNSWGNSTAFAYLTYESKRLDISGVRGLKVADFDNRYNDLTSNIEKITNDNINLYKYYKSSDKEYLSMINIVYEAYNANVKVYISNDGQEYKLLENDFIDYPGMRSYTLENFKLDKNVFYVKIEGDLKQNGSPRVFTKNECTYQGTCDNNVEIVTYLENKYININQKIIPIKTKTRNIKSGTKLNYKIYDENNNDVTNNFIIESNPIILSDTKALISFTDKVKEGNYIIKTIYEDFIDETNIILIEDDLVKLNIDKHIFVEDKKTKINYTIFNNEPISNITWSTSNDNVAYFENDELIILKSGRITIFFTGLSEYGNIQQSLEIIIYDKTINTTEEFLSIFEKNNLNKNYLLMNDLDFSNISYNNLSSTFTGVFDGNYHTIKNLKISKNDYVGIFYKIEDAIIKNLLLTNSYFKSTNSYVGSITGYSENSILQNIYVNTTVEGSGYSGGILGRASDTICSNCVFTGTVSTIGNSNFAYSGGIAGIMYYSKIIDSYNTGEIIAKSLYTGSTKTIVQTAGIGNSLSSSVVENCYNIGELYASSRDSNMISGLSRKIYTKIFNSYYLKNENITEDDEYSRTQQELKQKETFVNWDFHNIWYINNNYPILKTFPAEITNLKIDLFSQLLNTNSEYILSYIIEPYGNVNNIKIESLTPELISFEKNKLITHNQEGLAKIKLTYNNYSFIQDIELIDIVKTEFTEEYVKDTFNINFDINYYKNSLNNGYLSFNYIINNVNNKLKYTEYTKNLNLNIKENGTLYYTLDYCNTECINIVSNSLEIQYIDNISPIIKYNYDDETKTLNININDDKSGLKTNNEFVYTISANKNDVPNIFYNFINRENIYNIIIDKVNKYLWIKNIYDNVGNSLCENEYCVYEIETKNYYTVTFFDNDRTTILKKEDYKEGEIIKVFTPIKDDDNYYYEFIEWENYVDNLTVNKNIDLYARYQKISKKVKSDIYKFDNNYIRNINLKNINDKYYISDFLKNIYNNEGFSFYKMETPHNEFLKTGMNYSSKYKTYIIVLNGDVTGDGLIKMNDVMKLAYHLIDNSELSNEYYIAGDITEDNEVKVNDLMKLADLILNGGN